ncbi:hypothetical protein CBL_14394 [Carabus blaptoides fortunei]
MCYHYSNELFRIIYYFFYFSNNITLAAIFSEIVCRLISCLYLSVLAKIFGRIVRYRTVITALLLGGIQPISFEFASNIILRNG